MKKVHDTNFDGMQSESRGWKWDSDDRYALAAAGCATPPRAARSATNGQSARAVAWLHRASAPRRRPRGVGCSEPTHRRVGAAAARRGSPTRGDSTPGATPATSLGERPASASPEL